MKIKLRCLKEGTMLLAEVLVVLYRVIAGQKSRHNHHFSAGEFPQQPALSDNTQNIRFLWLGR